MCTCIDAWTKYIENHICINIYIYYIDRMIQSNDDWCCWYVDTCWPYAMPIRAWPGEHPLGSGQQGTQPTSSLVLPNDKLTCVRLGTEPHVHPLQLFLKSYVTFWPSIKAQGISVLSESTSGGEMGGNTNANNERWLHEEHAAIKKTLPNHSWCCALLLSRVLNH